MGVKEQMQEERREAMGEKEQVREQQVLEEKEKEEWELRRKKEKKQEAVVVAVAEEELSVALPTLSLLLLKRSLPGLKNCLLRFGWWTSVGSCAELQMSMLLQGLLMNWAAALAMSLLLCLLRPQLLPELLQAVPL